MYHAPSHDLPHVRPGGTLPFPVARLIRHHAPERRASTARQRGGLASDGLVPVAQPGAHPLLTPHPSAEELPQRVSYQFTAATRPRDGRPVTIVLADGRKLGNPLTDAAGSEDFYRLHDVFHLSYATLLGWSPVTRALLNRKRRSNPTLDENEDGGRAVVVEEGIAAVVFGYASDRGFLRGHTYVEAPLLDYIRSSAAPFEVARATAQDWEDTILTGMRLFRQLRACGGVGTVHADRIRRTMVFAGPTRQQTPQASILTSVQHGPERPLTRHMIRHQAVPLAS
ncbi:hypothetical protein [Amycolatopsis sp. lyj-23]|uniref:hypothetical protein n=1 Tax=Amycolatopsis sp. lyj-23 TaxID=2789283 RepID=UPI00397B1D81